MPCPLRDDSPAHAVIGMDRGVTRSVSPPRFTSPRQCSNGDMRRDGDQLDTGIQLIAVRPTACAMDGQRRRHRRANSYGSRSDAIYGPTTPQATNAVGCSRMAGTPAHGLLVVPHGSRRNAIRGLYPHARCCRVRRFLGRPADRGVTRSVTALHDHVGSVAQAVVWSARSPMGAGVHPMTWADRVRPRSGM